MTHVMVVSQPLSSVIVHVNVPAVSDVAVGVV